MPSAKTRVIPNAVCKALLWERQTLMPPARSYRVYCGSISSAPGTSEAKYTKKSLQENITTQWLKLHISPHLPLSLRGEGGWWMWGPCGGRGGLPSSPRRSVCPSPKTRPYNTKRRDTNPFRNSHHAAFSVPYDPEAKINLCVPASLPESRASSSSHTRQTEATALPSERTDACALLPWVLSRGP